MGKRHMNDLITLLDDYIVKEMVGTIENPSLSNFINKNNRCFVIATEVDPFIGIVELLNIGGKNKSAELSIAIKASARGKGYGQEAIEKVLDIGFQELKLNKVWLRVLEHNNRAISLYKKIGFVKEGFSKEKCIRGGKQVDQVQMSIFERELKKVQ